MQRNHRVWMPWLLIRDLGGGAKWPSNHFRLYTARCICTEAQEMRAMCIFDWQGIQTFFSRWNAKSQIRSLVCTLRNSNIAITYLVSTLRNSNDNSNYTLCSRVKTVSDSLSVQIFQPYSAFPIPWYRNNWREIDVTPSSGRYMYM